MKDNIEDFDYKRGVVLDKKKYFLITFFVTFLRVFLLSILGAYIVGFESLLIVLSLLLISAFVTYVIVYGK